MTSKTLGQVLLLLKQTFQSEYFVLNIHFHLLLLLFLADDFNLLGFILRDCQLRELLLSLSELNDIHRV